MQAQKRFVFSLIVMGISGIVAQILLLRELLISFYGNELSIGIILANWLLLESVGAFFLGKQIDKTRAKIELFIFVTLLFSVFLPGAVYLTRISKNLFSGTPGETVGISRIFFSSFLVFLPICLTHGALFTFGCKIHSSFTNKDSARAGYPASSIGKVYIYETIGTISGGILFTFLLIPYFQSLEIAFFLAILNIGLCVFVGLGFWAGNYLFSRKLLLALSAVLCIVFTVILLSPLCGSMHQRSLNARWPGQNVVYYKNSIYGNIAVSENQGQYTFFSDGVSLITIPTPDIAAIEEFAHFPLLFHRDPKRILIISGGAGGMINEILKYDIENIDYVELDPLILKAVRMFSIGLTSKELTDPRVNIQHKDGKVFIKETSSTYDLIFIGLGEPATLNVNRLFTKEFFSLISHRLNPDGIICFSLCGSTTYLSDETKNLNACILNALDQAFRHTRVIPGDKNNIYMGSNTVDLVRVDEHLLIERLKLRNIQTKFISDFHIGYRLEGQWYRWFVDSLKNATKKVNQDFRPIATFFSLSHWNNMLSPSTQPLFKIIEKLNLKFFVILLILIGTIAAVSTPRMKQPLRLSIPVCIAATGFSGMLFDLIIIFAFQIIYGYVFYWLGLLVSVFMAGTLAGGLWSVKHMDTVKNESSFFLATEAAIVIFALLLAPIIRIYGYGTLTALFFKIIFLAVPVIPGFLVGVQFPLANKIYLSRNKTETSTTAGLLYSSDLLGGWISGMIGGVILLPVLGLTPTCIIIVLLKSITFLIFALSLAGEKR
jgi:spermidine synthase